MALVRRVNCTGPVPLDMIRGAPPPVTDHRPQTGTGLGNLKIALRGGGGGVTWTPAEGGGGVGERGFRVGPFVLCKNGCWR